MNKQSIGDRKFLTASNLGVLSLSTSSSQDILTRTRLTNLTQAALSPQEYMFYRKHLGALLC